jgi:hypothetical protein
LTSNGTSNILNLIWSHATFSCSQKYKPHCKSLILNLFRENWKDSGKYLYKVRKWVLSRWPHSVRISDHMGACTHTHTHTHRICLVI